MKKLKRMEEEEKILDEIREKVIEESENLKAEKERLLNEKVTIEALEELTVLPMERIREISDEVRAKHKPGKAQKISHLILFYAAVAAFVSVTVILPVTLAVRNKIVSDRKQAEYEVRSKAELDYHKLLGAVRSGDLEKAKNLVLEEKIPVELEGFESDSALLAACDYGRPRIIPFLLENGARVLAKNKNGRSVMDLADEGTDIAVKRILGAALVATTPEGSPIRQLSQKGIYYSEKSFISSLEKKNVQAIKLFLSADEGQYAHAYDDEGILVSANKGYLDIIKLVFAEGKGIGANTKSIALLHAALGGSTAVIDYLLGLGADIDLKHDVSSAASDKQLTPLFCAIEKENAAFEHLLKKGADPNAIASREELLPIEAPMYYVQFGNLTQSRLNQIKLLIKYGADVNKLKKDGKTPIEYAYELRPKERRPIMRLLINAGARPPMTEEFFRELVFINDIANVKKFLDAGMDPNLAGFEYDDKETTALIKSAMLKHVALADMLIAYGADVNYRTPVYKKTALLSAVANEDLPMVRLLIDKGARVTQDVVDWIGNYYKYRNYDPAKTIRSLIEAKIPG